MSGSPHAAGGAAIRPGRRGALRASRRGDGGRAVGPVCHSAAAALRFLCRDTRCDENPGFFTWSTKDDPSKVQNAARAVAHAIYFGSKVSEGLETARGIAARALFLPAYSNVGALHCWVNKLWAQLIRDILVGTTLTV